MIFETHAHYEDGRFDEDRDEVLQTLSEKGVETVVNVGSSIETSKTSIVMAERYDFLYAAIGVHPSEIECLDEEGLSWIRDHANHEKVVAIGEIGLDYYWDKEAEVQQRQREWFWRQLQVAKEVNLPVIIHSRDAAEDTLQILKKFHQENPQIDNPGVVHCYSYSEEMAQEFVKMGYYIGVGGVVTFKNAKKLIKTVEAIPLDKILIETDCPYMAPEPHRGERNSSHYLPFVIEKIAQLKGVSPEEVEKQTYKNACEMYRL